MTRAAQVQVKATPQPIQAKPVPAPAKQGGQLRPVPQQGGAVARPGNPPPKAPVRPQVSMARAHPRHWLLLLSFVLVVILPSLAAAWYLWARTTDQYVSTVGFSVRTENATPSVDIFGGLAALGGKGSATDTDILYQYIRSHDMVEAVEEKVDLREMFARNWPTDFVFAFNPSGTIEDLTEYWAKQIQVYYDNNSGLITMNVRAFAPEDSKKVADAILDASSKKINELSAVARNDTMRLAEGELDKTRIALTKARQDMTAFRMRTQIVDPQSDLAGQMGVIQNLQQQLAEQLVAHDLLLENAKPKDNRVIQSQQKIDALRRLIDKERNKFSSSGETPSGESYAEMVSEYEKLAVDLEFAEGTYRSARIAYETALAEAQKQSRYLAVHISPRVPEASTEPLRGRLLALTIGVLLILWSLFALIYYSVRDRK